MSGERTTIRAVSKELIQGASGERTVITLETLPTVMPSAWVSFLKQRLHVLHIDYRHVGAGRIIVMSTPHAAESVVHLLVSAMECADHHFRTVLRNARAGAIHNEVAAKAAERRAELDKRV
jgi:hypothetical protein